MPTDAQELQIGRVIKPHGVRGELVVDPTTDQPDVRFAVGEVLRGKQSGKELPLTVKATRPHQGRLLVSFKEVTDRTAAESLRGVRFFAAPIVDDGEEGFYDHELEGLRVLNVGPVSEAEAHARAYDGAQPEPVDIGQVIAVSHGPAGTLLEIRIDADAALPSAGKTVLVPFRHAIVPIVDLENEAMVITPPDGLLDL